MRHLLSVFALSALVGFGCSTVKTSKLPGGKFRIQCDKGMDDCISRADKVCRDKGYTILSGHNQQKLLGGSSSSYRVATYSGELEVICGLVEPDEEEQCISLPPPIRQDVGTGPATGLCVPGSTQRCVGAGACEGGQTCLADGSGYGSCDCGAPAGADASPSPGSTETGRPAEARPVPKAPAKSSDSSNDGPTAPRVDSSTDSGPSEPPTVPGASPAPTPLTD